MQPNEDYKIKASRYVKGEEIGRGAKKKVFKAIDRKRGIEVAWNKIIGNNKEDSLGIQMEIQILKNLRHKNIIKFYDSWMQPKKKSEQYKIVFITELMSTGSLRGFIQQARCVAIGVIKEWCSQILEGLDYLHQREIPVIHRDIKLDNIFFQGATGRVKIGDLGFATTKQASSFTGTPEFMAPDCYGGNYDCKVDIWAFGMCVIEMVTMEYPYSECSHVASIYGAVLSQLLPCALVKIKNPEILLFINNCLQFDPAKRLSAEQLLCHMFLEIHPDDYESFVELRDKEEVDLILEKIGSTKEGWEEYIQSTVKPLKDQGYGVDLQKLEKRRQKRVDQISEEYSSDESSTEFEQNSEYADGYTSDDESSSSDDQLIFSRENIRNDDPNKNRETREKVSNQDDTSDEEQDEIIDTEEKPSRTFYVELATDNGDDEIIDDHSNDEDVLLESSDLDDDNDKILQECAINGKVAQIDEIVDDSVIHYDSDDEVILEDQMTPNKNGIVKMTLGILVPSMQLSKGLAFEYNTSKDTPQSVAQELGDVYGISQNGIVEIANHIQKTLNFQGVNSTPTSNPKSSNGLSVLRNGDLGGSNTPIRLDKLLKNMLREFYENSSGDIKLTTTIIDEIEKQIEQKHEKEREDLRRKKEELEKRHLKERFDLKAEYEPKREIHVPRSSSNQNLDKLNILSQKNLFAFETKGTSS